MPEPAILTFRTKRLDSLTRIGRDAEGNRTFTDNQYYIYDEDANRHPDVVSIAPLGKGFMAEATLGLDLSRSRTGGAR